jgi:small subunit ribosomal protein S8
LILRLKYTGRGDAVITGLARISKPGKRVYTSHKDIPWVRAGLGISIVSTPKGLMTGREARQAKLGGEILCTVW